LSKSKIYLFTRIKENFALLIRKGAYLEGEMLPSVRNASLDLGVNPNTVQKAYQELADEGYIEIIPKKGAIVKKYSANPEMELIQSIQRELDILKTYYSNDEILNILKDYLKGVNHD